MAETSRFNPILDVEAAICAAGTELLQDRVAIKVAIHLLKHCSQRHSESLQIDSPNVGLSCRIPNLSEQESLLTV